MQEGEASGSGGPRDEPPAGEDGSRQRSSLAAQGRSASTVLRNFMDREDITSTESLVDALNVTQTPQEQEALQEWVRAYIEWFNDGSVGNLTQRQGIAIQEYSLLAEIRADNAEKKHLLSDYFNSLCRRIDKDYQPGEEPLVEALEYTLQTIDAGVFAGNPAPLIDLSNKFLAKLDPTKTIFSKATYPTYRSMLYALHQTLLLIQQMAPSQWDPSQDGGLYSRFRAQVQAIAETAQYYPICYHASLLEQSLQRLASEGKRARLKDNLRRAGQGLKGIIYFYRGVKALAALEFDIESFQSGYESWQAAFISLDIEAKPWYDWHQAMHHACLLSLEGSSQDQAFAECLRSLLEKEAAMRKSADRKALRFGLVQQLSLLVLEGATTAVRRVSMEELSSLAESCNIPDGKRWLEDLEVLEELLDGLATIAVQSHGQEKDDAATALEILTTPDVTAGRRFIFWRNERQAAMRGAIEAWLGGQPLEGRLSSLPAVTAGPVLGGLFGKINKELRGAMPEDGPAPAAAQEVCQALKDFYRQPSFAQVKSLLDGKAKHVDSLQCQLMLIEQVEIKAVPEERQDDGQESSQSAEQDDFPIYQKQVKKPIALEDLFVRRSTKPGEAEHDIQRVLLVGNPGTGKTTLSRKLAYNWAQETRGMEFEVVYVLAVRALQQSAYDNTSFRRQETLANAIAKTCFYPTEDDVYLKVLRQQISQELAKPTTLVVLDGLDERHGASEQLLNQAKAGKHKLLMLSRSYGIEAERPLADIEVEHVGLNEEQMQAFITDELPPDLGEELLAFIQEQAIGAVAHVPVNLLILCSLWKDDGAGVRAATKQGSLPGLYRMLAGYIWHRYKDKQNQDREDQHLENQHREALFTALGQIAVRGLEQGRKLLGQGLVMGVLQDADAHVRRMVKDAGFLLLQSVGEQYEFPHLTFQEYFAGRWLATQFLSGKRRNVENFLSKHKYDSQYGVTLSFMAGEVSQKKGFEGIRQILELVEEEPREVVGVQHVLLQVRLLHEFLCMVGEDAAADLAELEGAFHILQSLKEWFREGLERVRQGGHRGDPCNLLSLLTTGLEAARSVVVHSPSLRAPLVNAGKDEDLHVHIAALQALSRLFAAAPVEAASMLDHMINTCKDENEHVRSTAHDALRKMVQAVPQQATVTLINACKSDDLGVRSVALEAISYVFAAAPRETSSLREIMINACGNEDSAVRIAAILALEKVVVAIPEEAKALRAPLLGACRDEDSAVRIASLQALGKVLAAAPETAPSLRQALLNACEDEDVDVCTTALKALSTLPAAALGGTPSLREPLVDASKDENALSRMAGSKALSMVFAAAPGETSSLREPILNTCRDEDSAVHVAAMTGLEKVFAAVPGEVAAPPETLLNAFKDEALFRNAALEAIDGVFPDMPETATARELILNACKDEDSAVRIAALEEVCKVVEGAPEKAPALLKLLLEASKNGDSAVRIAANSALGKVVVAMPGEDPALFQHVVNACKDRDRHVRHAAIATLVKVVAGVPAEAPSLLETLINACKDSDRDICRTAREALSTFVDAVPGEAPALVEGLVNACKDVRWTLRRAALSALEKVLAVAPGEAPRLVEPLLNACKDSSYRVRRAALEALRKVVEGAPRVARKPALRQHLINACMDCKADVRSAALAALERFSVQQLMEDYWATQNRACIQPIVARLYHTPVIIRAARRPDHRQVVLHLTAGETVTWDKPQQDVECFVQQIQSDSKQIWRFWPFLK